TQKFGYAVEREIEQQYRATHPECGIKGFPCYFGVRQYYSFMKYLKPDIMNWANRSFLEIKPFSLSGIPKGIAQLSVYTAVYGPPPLSFAPDTTWTPGPAIVDGTPTDFVNVSGIIFYTD